VFLTALTALTRLTVLTADGIDIVDRIDGKSQIKSANTQRNWVNLVNDVRSQ
jgi:hypothetical protein